MTGIVIDIGRQEQKGYATPAQVVKASRENIFFGTGTAWYKSHG